MKTRPWVVKAITISLFVVPVIALLIVYVAQQKTKNITLNASILTDLWLLCIGCIVVGFGVWRVRPWGFFMMMALGLAVIGADLQQIISNPATLNVWDFIDLTLVAAAFAFFTRKHVRAPYFNPQIRWWERPARHRVNLQGKFDIKGRSTESPILDISTTGCFVNVETQVDDGEMVTLNLDCNNIRFQSLAKVVRHSQNPKGIGLMFVETEKNNRREIKKIMKYLRQPAA